MLAYLVGIGMFTGGVWDFDPWPGPYSWYFHLFSEMDSAGMRLCVDSALDETEAESWGRVGPVGCPL